MYAKFFIFISLFSLNSICLGQKNVNDSLPFINLINKYDAAVTDNRPQALIIANKLELLSLQQNNLFFLADAYFKKSKIYYFDNNYNKAKAYAGKAIENAKRSSNYKVLLKSNNITGAIYYNLGEFKKAEFYYLEKINTAKLINDTAQEFGTYYNIGLIYFQQGNYLKSAEYNFKALEYFEPKKDTFNILSSLQSIGYTYMNLKDIPTSIRFYNKAVNYAKFYRDKYQLAGIYIDFSTAYGMINKVDSAIYYLDLALKISSITKDEFHYSIALNNKGGILINKKDYAQALILSKEAEKLNLKSDRKIALCEVYQNISSIYNSQNNFDSSLVYAYKGYHLALSQGQSKFILTLCNNISMVYEKKHNTDSALKYFKLYFKFNESLKQEEQLRGIAQKEFLFEKQNQEQLRAKEQQLSKTKLEKQKQINLVVIIASILLAIFLIIGIINFKQKQKANTLVVKQKLLLEDKQKEIIDSINYASRIQRSLMPTEKYISKYIKK